AADRCRADGGRHPTRRACPCPVHGDRQGGRQAHVLIKRNGQPQPDRTGGATATTAAAGGRGQLAAHIGRECQPVSGHVVGLPGGVARLYRRLLHGVLHGCPGARGTDAMTSSEPTPGATPKRSPVTKDADNAALCDALAVEHSTIYGYGVVSALSPPGVNN